MAFREIFDEYDDDDLQDSFSSDCYYYRATKSPDLAAGHTVLESTSIFGMRYAQPIQVELMRTSINQHIIHQPGGYIYSGGARFTIYPTRLSERIDVYDLVSDGDVIVARDKSVREFDILTRGARDYIFSFDVRRIIAVLSVDLNQNVFFYEYDLHYTLALNGQPVQATKSANGFFDITPTAPQPISSMLDIVWKNAPLVDANGQLVKDANGQQLYTNDPGGPTQGQKYTVEFACSPNYVVWNDRARHRGVRDNDLPKTVMCVKRPYFNPAVNPIKDVDTRQPILEHQNPAYDIHF